MIQKEEFVTKQKVLKEFITAYDDDLLYDFNIKMRSPYFTNIMKENYGIPKEFDVEQAKQDYVLSTKFNIKKK